MFSPARNGGGVGATGSPSFSPASIGLLSRRAGAHVLPRSGFRCGVWVVWTGPGSFVGNARDLLGVVVPFWAMHTRNKESSQV